MNSAFNPVREANPPRDFSLQVVSRNFIYLEIYKSNFMPLP